MTAPDKNAPIGVFDSGVGGLTAVRELRRLLPDEDIVYFGDTGRVPYGTRGVDTIVRYAKQDVAFLLRRGVKFIMAACGTVSSTLPDDWAASLPVGYTGVVEATAAAAAKASRTGRIGVIGTPATIRSGSYERALRAARPDVQITAAACPLFVPLVENGYVGEDNEVTRLVAQDYLAPVRAAGVDTLILGCTHYPLIAPVIAQVMGPGVTLVNSGREAALRARDMLAGAGLLREQSRAGAASFFVTDSAEGFASAAALFLGGSAPDDVTRVSVDRELEHTQI